MTQKTSNTHDKFHINLSDPNIYPDTYTSFLEYEPIVPSHTSDAHPSSDVSTPHVTSQDSVLSDKPVIPEIQETTHQVPCGEHSIFDPDQKVPAFEKALYLKVNEHSNWESGVSHALSLRRLAKLLNVKSHSQAHRGLQWLIENGWLEFAGKRKSDGAYFYKIIHHKCAPEDTPVDRDGRPQKCAVPTGAGSPSHLLADGKINWRIFVDWTVRKIHSCWTSGIVTMAVPEACKLIRFTANTIAQNAKKMMELGLLERLSEKFRLSEYQMFPKPYPERRNRLPSAQIIPKPMKLIKDWYYSHNKLWRFHRKSFRVQLCEHDGRWRESNLQELSSINPSIHQDFLEYMHHIREAHRSFAEVGLL